jgi:hypothetical protein
MGWGSFWTESTRRGSLAAIAVSLNTTGPWSDEGKTVSQVTFGAQMRGSPWTWRYSVLPPGCGLIPQVAVAAANGADYLALT